MPLVAENKGTNYEPLKEGTYPAVLNTVKDLGMVDTTFNGVTKKTHKCQFIWETDQKDAEGKPALVFERFTVSLNPKAQLYKRIKGLFSKEPPATLDLEKLVGTQTQLVITQNEGKDKTGQTRIYANVAATLKPAAGQKKLTITPLDTILKKKDELKAEVAKATNAITEANPITDDDIPF